VKEAVGVALRSSGGPHRCGRWSSFVRLLSPAAGAPSPCDGVTASSR